MTHARKVLAKLVAVLNDAGIANTRIFNVVAAARAVLAQPEAPLLTVEEMPPLPRVFEPSGGCSCAGPCGPCESCEANRQLYEEWLTEPSISPYEVMRYRRAVEAAVRRRL